MLAKNLDSQTGPQISKDQHDSARFPSLLIHDDAVQTPTHESDCIFKLPTQQVSVPDDNEDTETATGLSI